MSLIGSPDNSFSTQLVFCAHSALSSCLYAKVHHFLGNSIGRQAKPDERLATSCKFSVKFFESLSFSTYEDWIPVQHLQETIINA